MVLHKSLFHTDNFRVKTLTQTQPNIQLSVFHTDSKQEYNGTAEARVRGDEAN